MAYIASDMDPHQSNKGLIFFHILVLQENWVLMESRIPLKPVLGGVRILMNRRNKTESAVFLHCRFSLFLKDLFFQIIYEVCFHALHFEMYTCQRWNFLKISTHPTSPYILVKSSNRPRVFLSIF